MTQQDIIGKEYGSFHADNMSITMDEAIERLGMGKFQREVLFAAGLCFAADAMEVLLLSFLSVILKNEWDLTERQTNTIISVVFIGALTGTLLLGSLGDAIGRRPVFLMTATIIAVFGIGTAFCKTYEWLLVCRFLVGFGVGGLTLPFSLLTEFCGTAKRGSSLLEIEFFWTAGSILTVVIAKFSLGNDQGGSWQLFVSLCAIPCILSLIIGLLFVPESPRWLMVNGREEEALKILRLAACRNKLDPYVVFPEGTCLIHEKERRNQTKDNSNGLFSPKWFKITLLLWGTWFGLAFLYYGVIIAVSIIFTKHIDDDDDVVVDDDRNGQGPYEFDFGAIFISASAEIFGLILVILTIDRIGRIKTQTTTYLVGGFACLLLGLSASAGYSRTITLSMAFLARLAMMGASCTTWVSTSEILSTSIRSTGHGSANAWARLGGFFCPYVINEESGLALIGIFVFSISVLTAMVASQLPETAGRALGCTHDDEFAQKSVQNKDEPDPVPREARENSVGGPYQILS